MGGRGSGRRRMPGGRVGGATTGVPLKNGVSSEADSERELHDARIAGRRDIAGGGAGIHARGVELNCVVDAIELRVIERVVGFGTELDLNLFLDHKVLE